MTAIAVKVVFFASLREAVGRAEMSVSAGSVDELWQVLAEQLGCEALEALQQDNVRIAVNQSLVTADIELHSGDEIAFLPPVTGG